jgi:hypothetical protein
VRKPDPHADPAHERLTAILREAMPLPDEAALEDETRRIMLHLSVEPTPLVVRATAPAPVRGVPVEAEPPAPRRSRLKRWIAANRATKA